MRMELEISRVYTQHPLWVLHNSSTLHHTMHTMHIALQAHPPTPSTHPPAPRGEPNPNLSASILSEMHTTATQRIPIFIPAEANNDNYFQRQTTSMV